MSTVRSAQAIEVVICLEGVTPPKRDLHVLLKNIGRLGAALPLEFSPLSLLLVLWLSSFSSHSFFPFLSHPLQLDYNCLHWSAMPQNPARGLAQSCLRKLSVRCLFHPTCLQTTSIVPGSHLPVLPSRPNGGLCLRNPSSLMLSSIYARTLARIWSEQCSVRLSQLPHLIRLVVL
jgi:hypothetical protein